LQQHSPPAPLPDSLASLQDALAARYRFERELGRGGMATVFLVRDLKHDRLVALKVLHPELGASLGSERFQREIRLAARLQHPHILSVHDSGEDAGRLWYTMPYVEGESLRDRLTRATQLPTDEALRIVRQAAQALEYAHHHGVVHRDIKPENLLLTADGNTLVADFGIARGADAGDRQLTETGLAIGTPTYMSPEQAAGERTVDARTDVYSLGAVLYELLAGEPPFTGPTAQAIIAKRLSGPAPSLRVVRPAVPEAVDRAVAKALALVPADRFASMAEFRAALDGLLSGAHPAASRRTPGRRVGIALTAVAVLLAATGYWLGREREGSPVNAGVPASAAVLPFADQSPGHDQAYFSDGLAEELTTVLARIPGLRVAARTSAFQFRDVGDAREVGRRLGVGAVLEGSVRRSGDRLRVSAQLVDTRNGYEIWSEIYDRHPTDIFKVQEEIARAIGASLRIRLAGGFDSALSRRPTSDLEAYDLYLKGRFAWNQRTEATLTQAARYFEQATALDSGFSRAWAGLADTYVLLPVYSAMPPASIWPQARAAALRAIALDSTSAEAFTSLAYGTMLYAWDWGASEEAFRRALAADSAYPTAHHWYADFLAGRGRLDQALVQLQQAQGLDPLSRIIGTELAWVFNSLHRADEADSAVTRVLRLDPNYSQALFVLGQIRIEQRRYPEAIAAERRALEVGGFFGHGAASLVAAFARSGDRAGAVALLDSMLSRSAHGYVAPFDLAVAYTGLGDADRAFAALDRGIRERDAELPENFFEPLLDPLKSDPRYQRVARLLRGAP
jgi:eukaryotic-like serine/threonine-protein kinase